MNAKRWITSGLVLAPLLAILLYYVFVVRPRRVAEGTLIIQRGAVGVSSGTLPNGTGVPEPSQDPESLADLPPTRHSSAAGSARMLNEANRSHEGLEQNLQAMENIYRLNQTNSVLEKEAREQEQQP